jgi:positive regulator of sigma E activity
MFLPNNGMLLYMETLLEMFVYESLGHEMFFHEMMLQFMYLCSATSINYRISRHIRRTPPLPKKWPKFDLRLMHRG